MAIISKLDQTIIKEMLVRPVAFHPVLARVAGSVNAGLFLSQAWYWTQHTTDRDGWFYETRAQWTQETCLSRHEQDNARALLREGGLLEEKLQGAGKTGKPVVHFRVNIDVLAKTIAAFAGKRQKGQLPKTGKRANCRKAAIACAAFAGKRQSHLPKSGKPYKEAETPTETSPAETSPARPKSRAPADPRRQLFIEELKIHQEQVTRRPFTFTGKDGHNLDAWLSGHPDVTRERFRACLRNLATSEVNHAEEIYLWISTILKYEDSPLDRYGKPTGMLIGVSKNANSKTQTIATNINAALQRRADRRRAGGVDGEKAGYAPDCLPESTAVH